MENAFPKHALGKPLAWPGKPPAPKSPAPKPPAPKPPAPPGGGGEHAPPGAGQPKPPGGGQEHPTPPSPEGQPPAPPPPPAQRKEDYARSSGFRDFDQYRKWKEEGRLPAKSNPTIAPGVKFEGAGHIEGSEAWTGEKYAVFRNYHHEWHDKDWWDHHKPNSPPAPVATPKPSPAGPKPSPASPKPSPASPKPSATPKPSPTSTPPPSPTPPSPPIIIIVVSGGYYFRDACYWYPAWGYDSAYSYYPYDGPIYSCGFPPDQVIADVQVALSALGYYNGPINGLLGPETRDAIAAYQRDNGLYMTSAIDEPTVTSLGIG